MLEERGTGDQWLIITSYPLQLLLHLLHSSIKALHNELLENWNAPLQITPSLWSLPQATAVLWVILSLWSQQWGYIVNDSTYGYGKGQKVTKVKQ